MEGGLPCQPAEVFSCDTSQPYCQKASVSRTVITVDTGANRAWSHKAAAPQVWRIHPSGTRGAGVAASRRGNVGSCGEVASDKPHPHPLHVGGNPSKVSPYGFRMALCSAPGLDGRGIPKPPLTCSLPSCILASGLLCPPA